MGSNDVKLAILGAGNIGRAIGLGLVSSNFLPPERIILTRRALDHLQDLIGKGYAADTDNRKAVRDAEIVIVAVEPSQLDAVLDEIAPDLDPDRHILVSVVSGAGIDAMQERIGKPVPVVRAMPNTGITLGQSMTCVATNSDSDDVKDRIVELFDTVGMTLVIAEEQMTAATALCACGTAFFLRAVRAASQGGIEIGFHPREALAMAAQTALGAASLVLDRATHPEQEIDLVTTPRGCTIAGLNEMEHQGFSSAMIKGIVTSAEKARSLY